MNLMARICPRFYVAHKITTSVFVSFCKAGLFPDLKMKQPSLDPLSSRLLWQLTGLSQWQSYGHPQHFGGIPHPFGLPESGWQQHPDTTPPHLPLALLLQMARVGTEHDSESFTVIWMSTNPHLQEKCQRWFEPGHVKWNNCDSTPRGSKEFASHQLSIVFGTTAAMQAIRTRFAPRSTTARVARAEEEESAQVTSDMDWLCNLVGLLGT